MSKKMYFIIISVCIVFLSIVMGIILGLNNNEIILTISSNIDNEQVTIKLSKGTTIDLNDYKNSIDGYEFIGWYNDQMLDSLVETTHVVTSNKTIYAGYSKVINVSEIQNIEESSTSYTVISNSGNLLTDEHVKILLNNGARRLDLSRCKYKNNEFSSSLFNNSLITYIAFPDNIQKVKELSFYNCYNLKQVELSNNLITLESKSFYNCPQLEQVDFKENLKEIKENAFSSCQELKKLNLSSTVNSIQTNFITNCIKLSEINVDKNNQTFASIDGVLYSKDLRNLIKYPENKSEEYQILDSVEYINDYAFIDSNLSKITFNQKLQNVGISAFENCNRLKQISIPDLDCYELQSSCFKDCKSLVSVNLGKGLKTISEDAFKNCKNLNSINISTSTVTQSIEKIGNSAFENCISLKNFTIPYSVISVGDNIFYNCTELENVTIASPIKTLPQRMFYGCKSLKNIDLKNKISDIEDFVFFNCTELQSINNLDKVSNIGTMSFYNCEKLIELNLESVQSLGTNNFYNCLTLQGLILTSLKEINEGFIYNCPNLKSLILGSNLEKIENNSLLNCNKLELNIQENTNFNFINNLIITNDNKTILWFNGQLEEIVIPETIENIYNYAFSGKEKLKYIYVSENNKCYNSINGMLVSFDNKLISYPSGINNEKLELDSNILEITKYSIQSNYLQTVVISNNVKYIENGSILNTPLKSITLPFLGSSLESTENKYIGYIFKELEKGEKITYKCNLCIPESLEQITITKDIGIYDYAFYGSKFIKRINLSETVNKIESYAFYNCTNLETVKADGKIEKISEYTFGNNQNLNTIYLGYYSDVNIENNAFSDITSKINIYITYNISEIIDISTQTIYKNKYINKNQNSKYWTWRFINNEE